LILRAAADVGDFILAAKSWHEPTPTRDGAVQPLP
jgi:hypothetical protein